jgi:hypothetical protein
MSKFDTHGGYFAPKDYMKVEAGGSHEENPNGGVQIGVDQQGTPNLLEEGEPVYKDYVYSDNIKASERFLKENNIPEKYAGELYSKIADSFFSEAEERPMDHISRNGLEAMLGRLADAQESQKAYNEERQLNKLLDSLSPEEYDSLMGMLETGEQMQAVPMPQEAAAPEQAPMQPVEQPVMADGGRVNKYKLGNGLKRPFVGWQTRLGMNQNIGYSPTNIGYTLYPTVGGSGRIPSGDPNKYATLQGYMWPGTFGAIEYPPVEDPEEIILENVVPPKPNGGNSVRSNKPSFPNELQAIIDSTAAQAPIDVRNNLDELNLQRGPEITMPVGYAKSNRHSDGLIYPGDEQIEPTATVAPAVEQQPVARDEYGNPYLSTLPRYAGAIGSGLLGLYNAFQSPDKYTATRYKPFVPSGRISLQDQRYNPVDQQMLMNQVLAQGNSAQRALRNSGVGPSTAAALIAQDANTTGNIGNTFLQTWDANNQRRNQVIAANNQNEAQRAQFDYAIDAARQRALADAQMRNAYTDLQLQQLNYAAEGDKYAAISNQISNALHALSGIGQENFAMNQVNSNPANEGYGVLGGGVGAYLPYYYRKNYKCGGKKK